MPEQEPLTMLVANEHAEEIKLVTISMRGFYPGCRVEAVYSSDEAVEWASKQSWHIILVEENLSPRSGIMILPELRRRAPQAAIIVQSEHTDSDTFLQVIRGGADFYLFKNSPAFLTELMIVTGEAVKKRELSAKLDLTHERYLRLVETLPDTVYELDSEGRFVYVSPHVTSLLGYAPEELAGAHFTKIVHPDQRQSTEHRFNERRSGARSSRQVLLRLLPKAGTGRDEHGVEVELHAKGLYDSQRRFIGTLGILRDVTGRRQQEETVHRLQSQLRQTDRLLEIGRLLIKASRDLHDPLTALQTNSQQLLSAIRALQLERQLETMAAHASQAAQVREELAAAVPLPPETEREREEAVPPRVEPPVEQRPTVAAAERRRWSRVSTHIESSLTVEGSTWNGTALNMSLGGAYLTFADRLPAVDGQPIYLTLRSAGGTLELHGTVRERGGVDALRATAAPWSTALAVEFSSLGDTERQVLASLLDAVREQAFPLSIEGLVPLAYPPDRQTGFQRPFESIESSFADRRLEIRAKLTLPVRVEPSEPASGRGRHIGLTVNVSRGGACLQVKARPDMLAPRLALRLSLATPSTPSPGAESVVTGDVIWTAPDPSAPKDLWPGPSESALRVGLRFRSLEERTEREISRLIARLLTSPLQIEDGSERTKVVHTLRECRNSRGRRLALYHDLPRDPLGPGTPLVIIAPGYGRTKTDHLVLAQYLAGNGFQTLRFDHSNHIGESDGILEHTTLTDMQSDLLGVLDFAAQTWPAAPIAVIAPDLDSRAALKVAARDHRIALLILLNGVLDVRHAIAVEHRQDLVEAYLQGERRGLEPLWGLNVNTDHWLQDAVTGSFVDAASAVQDAERVRATVLFLTPQISEPSGTVQDGIRRDSFQRVLAALGTRGEVIRLKPEAFLPARRAEGPALSLFRELVTQCRKKLRYRETLRTVLEPVEREIDFQRRIEQERLKLHYYTSTADALALWRAHVQHVRQHEQHPEHWRLLDHLHRLLGEFEDREPILEVGCGHGDFARLLLINQAYRSQHKPKTLTRAARYVGLDSQADFVTRAGLAVNETLADLNAKFAGALAPAPPLQTSWLCADWNSPLPFPDGRFSRVVCCFALGYVQDPLYTLRELWRVLAPRGTLLITTWTPDTDLSMMYRAHSQDRELLRYLGRLRQALREGRIHSFDPNDLARLLRLSGAVRPRIYTAFAGNACIGLVEKPNSSG